MENLPYLANIPQFLERDKKRGDPLKAAPIAKKFRSSVAALGHFFLHAPQQIRLLQFLEHSTCAGQRIVDVRVLRPFWVAAQVMDGVEFNAQHFGYLRGGITLVWCYTLWSCFRFKAAPIRRLDFAGL